MANIILVLIVCISLALSLFIGIYALFRTQTTKKNYFLLMQSMVIVYLVGYLLELTSSTADEAYTSTKVLYIGAYFVAVFAFFFIADYCNIKLHPVYIRTPMLLLALAAVLLMWTTKSHLLVYREYGFGITLTHRLVFIPGPLYSVLHAYPTFCMLLTMAVLIYQMTKWKKRHRRQLLILLVCLAIPFVVEGIYLMTLFFDKNASKLYLTPYSIALMSVFLYLGVVRFNVFEIISVSTTTAMEHIREGFILVDEDNNYLSFNRAAARMLPGITKLVKGESISSASDWPVELKDLKSGSVEFSVSNGKTTYLKASVSPVFAQNRALMAKIILFSDITDNVNLMKELENAAYIDALTGLYNRKHFTELAIVDIERALRLNQDIYTVMLDLDFFKKVNDTHGHAAGDLVLKATAGIIRQTIRSYDLLGRYGGEEFVLLITSLDPEEAYKLMERIRENMEHCIVSYEGEMIKITCSIGLAKYAENDTLDSAVKKADDALYAAKHSGRNLVKVYGAQ
ncbi:MAG: diguanylate cyclase [Treponema sp.]|nr:diguanylate cyclase [Treponema sp.]